MTLPKDVRFEEVTEEENNEVDNVEKEKTSGSKKLQGVSESHNEEDVQGLKKLMG